MTCLTLAQQAHGAVADDDLLVAGDEIVEGGDAQRVGAALAAGACGLIRLAAQLGAVGEDRLQRFPVEPRHGEGGETGIDRFFVADVNDLRHGARRIADHRDRTAFGRCNRSDTRVLVTHSDLVFAYKWLTRLKSRLARSALRMTKYTVLPAKSRVTSARGPRQGCNGGQSRSIRRLSSRHRALLWAKALAGWPRPSPGSGREGRNLLVGQVERRRDIRRRLVDQCRTIRKAELVRLGRGVKEEPHERQCTAPLCYGFRHCSQGRQLWYGCAARSDPRRSNLVSQLKASQHAEPLGVLRGLLKIDRRRQSCRAASRRTCHCLPGREATAPSPDAHP